MDSVGISTILQQDELTRPYFKGVFSADNVLQFKPSYASAIVVNTDPSSEPGQHWVAIFIDKHGVGNFFDSYGNKPEYYHSAWNLWLSKWTKHWMYNSRVVQPDNSVHCGVHCLFFIHHRCQGMSFPKVVKLYTDNKVWNDSMAEHDIEAHTHVDVDVDTSMLAVNQTCCAKCNPLK
jgi:hypothetical protein